MARTVDAEAHALRRDAFVDVAQRLIQNKGYESTSIQNVIDEVGASKGAFFHYFGSKAALLDAVVERLVDGAIAAVAPLVDDPGLTAAQKLQAVFAGIAQWKGERTELLVGLLRVWVSDENAIVREKMRRRVLARLTPMLAAILRQGEAEGAFTVDSPEADARVLVSLVLGVNEAATELYFARQAGEVSMSTVERTLRGYFVAFERLLGVPAGALAPLDPALLRQWYA